MTDQLFWASLIDLSDLGLGKSLELDMAYNSIYVTDISKHKTLNQ